MKFAVERRDQVSLLAIAAVFLVLPTIAIILRLLARRIAHRTLDVSDYLMIAAWVLAVGFQIVCFLAVLNFGVGYHASEIKEIYGERATEGFSILLFPIQGLWALSLSCCKLSVLLMYRKLFPVKKVIHAVNISIALIFLFLIIAIIGGCTICQPFAYNWDKTIPNGHCGDLIAIVKTTGAGNVITDVAALTVALPSLFALTLPCYKKLVLMLTFGVGFLAVIVSILRLITLVTVDFDDLTYTCVEALIYSAVEPSLAIVLATIPMLRPLLGRSKYSANRDGKSATARFSFKSRSTAKGPNGSDGFEQLSGNTSQYELRPPGPKHNVHISVQLPNSRDSSTPISPLERRTIMIQHDWEVRQEPETEGPR
ncbi:hypothetical protein PFICI_08224 [Pestalotiopsis fici W106-1]|uniref:Rhodopsin domain-containing protein n=1 Tax=Pestalotiopsis fici (strain W106-1 / CGMCC3.15140) TaxID=1229662 RepID=W3X3N8_PESFW|nr:uncharacterized protein PFICI_08224 [Pestalotiopsis fici W106-1]ETS80695.1 hypothetical protein PFICI_08224 [Pestalotiopsis fici W106-1]